MPADPGTPEEDQDQVLAERMAAFPDEDGLFWEDPEYLEYLTDAGLYEGPEDPAASAPDEHLANTDSRPTAPGNTAPGNTAPGAAAPTAADAANGTAAGDTTVGGTTAPADDTTLGDTTASAAPVGAAPADGTAAPSAVDARSARAGFAHGGAADGMPPGAVLASLADQVWRDGLDGVNDDELTGVLQAAHRLGAWSAALQLSAVSELAARRRTGVQARWEGHPLEDAEDEVAVALTMTRYGAGCVLSLALALGRLPRTRAALAAGLIDERRAFVIADEMAGLGDEHAAAVEALIIAKAAGQTTGQLRPAVRRAVIAADPAAAKRRKDEALKDARVEASSEPSGTARLSGRDLPPAQVLAADKHLTAVATAMKKTGAQGTMDQLRAQAYLHLLAGQEPACLLLPPATGTGTPADGTPGTGTPPGGTPGGTPGTGTPGTPGGGTPGAGTAGVGAPGRGLPALRGVVNLTMPLAAWLGWSQSPGQVPGFGTVDAEDSRALAAMLARDPATKWCITLTDTEGHAVAHGCAKKGPQPPDDPDPGPDPGPDPHAGPGPGPGPGPGRGPRAGPGWGPGSGAGPGSATDPGPGPRAGPGPPGDPGWISTVTITPLQTGTCTHPRETHSYQPSPTLRHIIEIRQATCTRPGCRRAATACDLDHTIPYHLGGRTCECDLAPACEL